MKKPTRLTALLISILVLLAACQDSPTPTQTEGADEKAPTLPPATRQANPQPPPSPTLSPTENTTLPTPTSPPQTEMPEEPGELKQLFVTTFADAGSIDFTFDPQHEGMIVLAFGRENDLFVTRSADGGRSFEEPVVASSTSNVFVYDLERPAVVAAPDGRIHVAWPENSFPGSIWYAFSDDDGQSFSESIPLSRAGRETVLVRLALDPAGDPVAAWLQNSGLSFTRTADDGKSFLPDEVIDDQTCDCCHPQPVWFHDDLLIAYRNLVLDDDGRQIRDIYVTKSADGGATFAEPVRVSDAPWYISACPFSGPSMATDGDNTLFVSWMDGRDDKAGNLSQTDIWLATSTDGGQSFSPNRRINQSTDVYNNLPSLAYDESGRLHVIWQAAEEGRDVILYTSSADHGETFAPPQVLVDSSAYEGQRPGNASLYLGPSGELYVSWVDSANGYLAAWRPAEAGD